MRTQRRPSISNEEWAAKVVQESKKEYEKAQGVHIDVTNLSYSVIVEKRVKTLLKNVSFQLEPGSLCALMGPSGAGKSTLLDLLANRKLYGNWSGQMMFNHAERTKWFNRDSAYVLQDDVHIPTLTVEETIYYSAWVRLPDGCSEETLRKRVTLLIELMGLTHIKDNIVGDSMRKGISGGQLKRLSIAVEIVAMPNLIFLDEPTSGLDSSIALEVMGVVRKLADQNRTCISTIHQPSPEVFALFDKVILLAKGVLVYAGSTDSVAAYFASLGYALPEHRNPAEFIISISDEQIRSTKSETPFTAEQLQQQWSTYSTNPTNNTRTRRRRSSAGSLLEAETIANYEAATPEMPSYTRMHATSKATQFRMLMSRSWLASIRDKEEQLAQIVKNLVVGLLIGACFYGQAKAEEPLYTNGVPNASVTNVSSLLFFAMMYTLLSNIQAIPYLCSRNVIYRRELAAFSYSAAPYWLSQCLVILPVLLWNQLLFMLITYWLCGFPNEFGYFMYFFLAMYLTNISSFYFAMLLAGSLGDERVAFVFFPMAFLFMATFAGYSIQVNDIPPFWHWAPYINYARWTFEGLMVNQWEDYETDDLPYALHGNGDVLAMYEFTGFDKNWSFWILILNIVIIALGTYVAMRPLRNNLKVVEDAQRVTAEKTEEGEISNPLSACTTNIKQNLLTTEEMLESAKTFKQENNSLDVAWYRQSTGEPPESRGCRLTFRNLSYSVKNKADNNNKLTILKSVSGRAQPGEMVALMGASGAGKSTLLDVLAGRKTTGETSGDMLFNGIERTRHIMQSSAYVMQDNVHMGLLTVYESLYYAAELRLREKCTKEAKIERVEKILNMLGLAAVRDTIVGTESLRGISGGQLKRLSIGVEIINLPDLIFLDEPTTGLDSAISHEVMCAVRNLANQNRTILCTIHQPSPDTYLLFDKLLLLAEGRVIYFGPAREVVTFFTGSPYQFFYKIGSNPADYVIAIGGGFLPAENGVIVSGGELAAYYSSSALCRVFMDNIDTMLQMDEAAAMLDVQNGVGRLSVDGRGPRMSVSSHSPSHGGFNALLVSLGLTKRDDNSEPVYFDWNTSTLHQIRVLTHRRFVNMRKNYVVTVGTFARHIIVGIFYGTIYFQMAAGTDPTAYNNRLGLFFFSLMFVLVGHQQLIPELQSERLMFYRERSAKAYGAFSYLASQWILLFPLNFVNVFLYSVLVYFLSGLRDNANSFWYFYYVCLAVNFIGLFICQIISNIAPSTQTAMSFFPISLFFSTAFAGFIVYLPKFPDWLGYWGPYLTFFRFAFQAITLNEFQGNSELPDESAYIHTLGFEDLNKDDCAAILMVFLVFYGVMAFVTLKYINFERR